MKTTRIVLLSLFFLGVFAGTGAAEAQVSVGVHIGSSGRATVDIGFFYDDLAQYGNWVQRPSYGWVWRPHRVTSTWRPYERGHWVMTDEGWTWISDEPYGWATYHYGRWYHDPVYGWEWVPGNEWAPAWVSWQEGGDYVGWAPLPPAAEFRDGGFGGADFYSSIEPDFYVFVPTRWFLAPRITTYIVPRVRIGAIFHQTHNITNYRRVGDRIFNEGLPVDRVQRAIGRTVPHFGIGDLGADLRHQGGRVQANHVNFFRPQVDRGNVPPPSERPGSRHSVVRPEDLTAGHSGRVPPGQAKKQPRPPSQPPNQGQVQQPERRPQGRPQPADRPPHQGQPQQRPEVQRPPRQDKPAPAPPVHVERPNRPQPPVEVRQQPKPPRPPQPQATPDNRPRGQGQGQGQGQAGGKPQGRPQGQPQGQPQAKPQGKPQGKPEAKPHGKPDKPPGKPDGKPPGDGSGR